MTAFENMLERLRNNAMIVRTLVDGFVEIEFNGHYMGCYNQMGMDVLTIKKTDKGTSYRKFTSVSEAESWLLR